LHLHYEGLIAG